MVALLAGSACDDGRECEQLRDLLLDHQRALGMARARAKFAPKLKQDAARAEKVTKAFLTRYGLNMADDEITAALQARVATISGAQLSRGQRRLPSDDPTRPPVTETVWTVVLPERSFVQAAARARDLAALPPLLQLAALLPVNTSGRGWKVELVKVPIDRVPIDFEPQRVPMPRAATEVAKTSSFCGSAELRKKIADARAQIETLQDVAAEATVYLPTQVSWEGLRLRAQLAVELESEARRLLDVYFEATKAAAVRVKAIGQERDVIILDIYGGAPERARVERQLPDDVLRALKVGLPKPGQIRFAVVNRVAERARPPGAEGGERPRAIDLGLPTPEELKRQFERARRESRGEDGAPR